MDFKKTFTLDDYRQMYELEKKFYDESHITPYEEAYRWHLKFPNHCRAMEEHGCIIGFVDLFPVKADVFQQLLRGNFNDRDLKEDDLADPEWTDSERTGSERTGSEWANQERTDIQPVGTLYMFLSCLVVEKNYRHTDVLKRLLLSHIEYYHRYMERGWKIDQIITDNVTKDGERFSERMGFQRVAESDHSSSVFLKPYGSFVTAVQNLK